MKFIGKILCVLLLIILCSVCASAVIITDLSQISDMEGDYELSDNIVLPDNFIPIGTNSKPFKGTFDGKGYIISGKYSSLFACTEDATIKNIKVENANVKSDELFGGIVGEAKGTTLIENCSFAGVLELNGGFSVNGGGIVGVLCKKAMVQNCYVNVNVTVNSEPFSSNIGGVCGRNKGTVKTCFSEGSMVTVSSQYRAVIGGIVGENLGTVLGCGNSSDVSGTIGSKASQTFVGGVIGYNNNGTVLRCANIATSVFGYGKNIYPAYAGGVAGANVNGELNVVKNTANIFAFKSYAGGITALNLGHKGSAVIVNALNEGEVVGTDGVYAGISAENTITGEPESSSEVKYSLNVGQNKGLGRSFGSTTYVYSIGEEDGYSIKVTDEELCKEGLDVLENNNNAWQNNCEIVQLPDLLIVYDETSPVMLSSREGNNGMFSYFLYSPDNDNGVSAIIAAFYVGSKYNGMKYVEKTPGDSFIKLAVTDIPEGTDRIKIIAFKDSFATGIIPAKLPAVEKVINEKEMEAESYGE